jgi:hypothetical protein
MPKPLLQLRRLVMALDGPLMGGQLPLLGTQVPLLSPGGEPLGHPLHPSSVSDPVNGPLAPTVGLLHAVSDPCDQLMDCWISRSAEAA